MILKVTSVLHQQLPSNCLRQMALGHQGGAELLPDPMSEITTQHDPKDRLNEPDDEGAAALPDDQDAMEEDAKASRGLSVLLEEEN